MKMEGGMKQSVYDREKFYPLFYLDMRLSCLMKAKLKIASRKKKHKPWFQFNIFFNLAHCCFAIHSEHGFQAFSLKSVRISIP